MLLRRLSSTLLFLATLLSPMVPASAQLASGSAWQNAKSTDFLNLYQGANTVSVKPEVLMLIDNSASTFRLMFHPLFPNNWQDEYPNGGSNNGSSATSDLPIYISFGSTWATSSSIYPTNVTVGFAANGGSSLSTVTASGVTYTIGGARTTTTVSGTTYATNTLIKADGTEVTWNDVPTAHSTIAPWSTMTASSVTAKNDPINWMLCATHMRIRCTYGSHTRDIDFPLPWYALDSNSALTSAGYTPATAIDPVSHTAYQFDTVTAGVAVNSSTSPTAIMLQGASNNTWHSGSTAYGSGYTGFVRSRYIEWVFWGQDSTSPVVGGSHAYFIPNAIPSTDTTVLYSVTPNTGATYDGSTGLWTTTAWSSTPATAFSNQIPNRTRCTAIKECVIKTWLNHQTDIMLSIRFLSPTGSSSATSTGVANALTTSSSVPTGNNWMELFPANIATQIPALASTVTDVGYTPLLGSMLNSLAQFTSPKAFATSIQNAGYSAAQLACGHHFLIILTDGAADSDSPAAIEAGAGNYPYYQQSGTYANAAYTGNGLIKTYASRLGSNSSSTGYWNVPTLAGVAAHGGDGSSTSPTWIQSPLSEDQTGNYSGSITSVSTSAWGLVPFWVNDRYTGGTTGTLVSNLGQCVQVMTVGVSLGVNYYTATTGTTILTGNTPPSASTPAVPIAVDFTGSKFRLLAAACFGDPNSKNYVIANAVPFYLQPVTNTRPSNACYFFDGRDPATLISNLDSAIVAINEISGVNSTSAPVFPTLGAGMGNEVYVGNFLPPVTPGPLWTGDLLAYPTTTSSVGTLLLDQSGNQISGNLSASTAQWSASAVIGNRGWLNRRIYTRLPSNSTTWNTSITRVNLGASGTDQTQGYSTISSLLPGGANALTNWQFFVGADTSSGSTPLTTRNDSIMGDIIGSTPTVLQYATLPSTVQAYSSALANAWSGHTSPVFRVIFVGDNQGLFHAFGEVSWTDTTTNSSQAFSRAVADELFAFAPTEILPNINVISSSGNKHYYAVDGAPSVYLLDLPQNSAQATGNGMFDAPNSYATEQAIVVFGLGKGGRSYYALNVADPVNPTMAWALCPNEGAYNYPSSRLGGTSSGTVIANMGLATSQPSFARVATSNDGGVANKIIDAVLLGGGYSDWNIESALPATAVTNSTSNIACYPATGTALGRSVVAMDVSNGHIIETWALTGTSSTLPAGPVMTALVPVTIVAGSGITERAYFSDYYGSIWALGSSTLQTGTYNMLRTDTPIIDNWSARQIYCQTVIGASTPAVGNGVISTVPVPFLLPSSPLSVTTSGVTYSPFTIGLAFTTGDRNNPLDNFTYTQWTAPSSAATAQNHLNVLFDRQDLTQGVNASTFTFSNLADATAASTTFDTNPGDVGYYLNHASPGWYGYSYPLGAPVANPGSSSNPNFIPKGITSPLVLEGNLFFSTFTPTNVTCAGGGGGTSTFQVCNVLAPTFNNTSAFNTTNAASDTVSTGGCKSGLVLAWTGVASNMSARTILTGVQAGLTSGSGVNDTITATAQNLIIQNLNTSSSDRFPKIRIWRVVH